jgi:hypothetical protein
VFDPFGDYETGGCRRNVEGIKDLMREEPGMVMGAFACDISLSTGMVAPLPQAARWVRHPDALEAPSPCSTIMSKCRAASA